MPQRATFFLFLTSKMFMREILRGVIQWSKIYGPVAVINSTGDINQLLPKLRTMKNVGVIARFPTPEVLDAIKDLGVPVITIEPSLPEYEMIKEDLGFSEILSDAEEIVRMGVEHFVERQFRRFAFCGVPLQTWSNRREEAFARQAARYGGTFIYSYPTEDGTILSSQEERPYLVKWLRELPKPVGVMACNDDRAAEILEICEIEEINVPDQVAVLGVDNNEFLCELTNPSLSSVTLNLIETGFQAASLLWSLISETKTGYHRIYLRPTEIVLRRSTEAIAEVIAKEDSLLQRAVHYIRENYQQPIDVAEIARKLDVSRRTLERRFAERLNTSVREQIEWFRFQQAQSLLCQTEDSVEEIARITGFINLKPMVRAFKKKLGVTPSEFRKSRRMD